MTLRPPHFKVAPGPGLTSRFPAGVVAYSPSQLDQDSVFNIFNISSVVGHKHELTREDRKKVAS